MTTIWHTSFLSEVNDKLYKNVLTSDNIVSDEVCKKYNDKDYFGVELERDNPITKIKEKFFLKTEMLQYLPILVTDSDKFSHRSVVYKFIIGCQSKRIPTEKRLKLPELSKFYAHITHSHQEQFNLYKKLMLISYFERLNIRIVSEASFGKDGIIDILSLTNGGVANLYNATLGKLKYSLRNDFIAVNEIGGLKKEEISSLQIYLTQAGAYKPKYENNSRSVAGTKETADLMHKSHIILHNIPSYYLSKGQQYFEQMFTEAVHDRFPALLMEGYVTQDFSKSPDYDSVDPNDIEKIKDCIATINWYKANNVKKPKYEMDKEFWGFKGKQRQRALRSFTIISKWLSHMAENEDEFKADCELLKQCKDNYQNIVQDAVYEKVQEEVVE